MASLKLLHKDGSVVAIGDMVTNFRGEVATVREMHPPKHIGSTGHVTTDLGYHFVSVYGLEFVPDFYVPKLDFNALCVKYLIAPNIALENDNIAQALRNNDLSAVESILKEEF